MFSRHWRAAVWGLLSLHLTTSTACQPDVAGSIEAGAEGPDATLLAELVSCDGVPEWNSSTIYAAGNRVVYRALLYEALTSIYAADPVWGTASGWYKLIGACSASGGDTTAPTQVTGLRTTSTSSTQVSFAWNASTDNVGVSGYRVFRNNTPLGNVSGTSYTDSGLSPSTQYSYTVKAYDAANNESAASVALSVTTSADGGGGGGGGGGDGDWHPPHLAIGTVYEAFSGTDQFFAKVNPHFPSGRRLEYGYLYLNGGVQFGEWSTRAGNLARKSKEQGMTPIYVVYGIGGNTDDSHTVAANLRDANFLVSYFKGLRDVGQIATDVMAGGRVGYVIEPDTLGYLQQQVGGDPTQIVAATHAAYDSGVLNRTTDPVFDDNLNGLVQSINYTLHKYTKNAFIGWQLNLWAAPGAPAKGIMHATEESGMTVGKDRIRQNARANAGFAEKAGVKYKAQFISIDKYGLDGGIAAGANPNDPASSYWFWNADLWNNYLLFAQTLKETLSLPVVLWQLPVGHINGTTLPSNTAYNASGRFPDLTNNIMSYEDSASPFLFGDTFTLSGNRLSYFSKNEWNDPKVSVSGNTVTWKSHMPDAAKAGVVLILMGAGVGPSTRGIPQASGSIGGDPTDNYYWISRVQEYYRSPVLLP